MMKTKRVKAYWLKKKENFRVGSLANARAKELRVNEHIAHVIVDQIESTYTVSYSIPKWYAEQMEALEIVL